MERQRYLQYRKREQGMEILYEAALDQKVFKGSFGDFSTQFMVWQIPGIQKQQILQNLIDEYDKKFSLVLISYNEKLIDIQ